MTPVTPADCTQNCAQGRRCTCTGKPLPTHHSFAERAITRLVLWLLIVLLMVAAAHTAVAAPVGSWNKPGENPFKGSRWHAVMSYSDMPLTTRVILGLRVQWSEPDILMRIDKQGVTAQGQVFLTDIIGMHFGKRQRYGSVDRSGWSPLHAEFAPGWCFEQWCVGSPYVCNNIFAIMRRFSPQTLQREAPQGAFREVPQSVSEPVGVWVVALVLLAAVGFRKEALNG